MYEYLDYIKKFKIFKNITKSITDRINNINKIEFYEYEGVYGNETVYVVDINFKNDYESIRIEAGVPHRGTEPFININDKSVSDFDLYQHTIDNVTCGEIDKLFEKNANIFNLILVTFLAEFVENQQ